MRRNLIILVCLVFCGFLSNVHADTVFYGSNTQAGNGTYGVDTIDVTNAALIFCAGPSLGGCASDATTSTANGITGFLVNGTDYTVTFEQFEPAGSSDADLRAAYATQLFWDPVGYTAYQNGFTGPSGDDSDTYAAAQAIASLFNGQVSGVDPITGVQTFLYILAAPGNDTRLSVTGNTWDLSPDDANIRTGDTYAVFTPVVSTPEPNTLLLFGTGLGLLFGYGTIRRRKMSGQSSL